MLIFSLGFCKLLGSCFHAWEMQFSSCANLTQCLPLRSDCICVLINVIETCSFPQSFYRLVPNYLLVFSHISHQDSQAGLVIDDEGKSYAEEGKRAFGSLRTNGGGVWSVPRGLIGEPGCSRQQPSMFDVLELLNWSVKRHVGIRNIHSRKRVHL